jgi:YD repeat-containing protein
MLDKDRLGGILRAARERLAHAGGGPAMPTRSRTTAPGLRPVQQVLPASGPGSGRRAVASVPPPGGGPVASPIPGPGTPKGGGAGYISYGTGYHPWWTYKTETSPGIGNVFVNVGSGNMMLDAVDMNVPHKGVPLVYKRTFNSQSSHDVLGSDGTQASVTGNGWTSTYDAHLSGDDVAGPLTVWDDTGARFDYTWNGSSWIPPMGEHSTLVSDGQCGFLWTNKSGVTLYFVRLSQGTCPSSWSLYGGYAGRLRQIFGRNHNTYLTLNYAWVAGNASATGRIASISVQAESGLQATLNLSDVAGYQVVTSLTRPDGTLVNYNYGSGGYLTGISHPRNSNANSTTETYGYGQQQPGITTMSWAAGPKWNEACLEGNCGADGGYLYFSYQFGAATVDSANMLQIDHYAAVNPTIADGISSGPIHAGYSPSYTDYLIEYFTTGNGAWPTFRDSDGHAVNWVVDGSYRATQTQAFVGGSTYLTENQSWDNNNNLVSYVDPRGNETDAAYDAAGNPVAVARPGSPRPTTLIDYDAFGNVQAVCDPAQTFPNGTWSGQYTAGSDTYCTSLLGSSNHQSFAYTYPAYEPYGQLSSITSASGYVRAIYYDAASQAGMDFGLPTRVAGTGITQFDSATQRIPSSSARYDQNGNVICFMADSSSSATAVMTYDAMNRLLKSADPDDSSLTSSACAKTAGIAGSTIVTTRTYNPDGSLATSQSPSEAAAGYGTVYSYDYDGNTTAVSPYQGNPSSPQAARIKSWYDGVDRLVETLQPADPNTSGDFPIAMRYVYDLSQGGLATTLAGQSVAAHGNLYLTEKNTKPGAPGVGPWIDFKYSAFDLLNRVTTDYAFAPCPAVTSAPAPQGPIYCSQPAFATQYDWDSSQLPNSTSAPGQLVATLDGVGASRRYTYSALNSVADISYSGDGGKTTSVTYAYDLDGRLLKATNSNTATSAPPVNWVTYSYSPDGDLTQVANGALNQRTNYTYYPDRLLAGVGSVISSPAIVSQPNLYQYAYRADGALSHEAFGASSQSITWTYTPGGRMTAMTDFGGLPSISAEYNDGYGRLSKYTTPSGSYASISYDSQGQMLQYSDPYSAIDGEMVSSHYNIRNDLISRTYQPNPGNKPGFQYSNVQGVLVQNSSDQYDGRTGAPLFLTTNSALFTYDRVGRLLNGLTYDAESRVVSGDAGVYARAEDVYCNNGGTPAPESAQALSYHYDAQGQLFQDISAVAQTQTIRQWFWNGKTPLYTTTMNSNGSYKTVNPLQGYGADGLGSVSSNGNPGLTVTDLDFDGAIAGYHNNTGHSSWGATNPFRQWCVGFTDTLPASGNYIGPNGTPPADDGSSDAGITVMSTGRAFLSHGMGFATPDYSSSTPYSSMRGTSSGSRGTLGEKERNLIADSKCESGWRYEGGDCKPLTQIGGSGTSYQIPNLFESISLGYDPFGSPGHHGGGSPGGRLPTAPTVSPPSPDCEMITYYHYGMPFAPPSTSCVKKGPPLTNKQIQHFFCVAGGFVFGFGVNLLTKRTMPDSSLIQRYGVNTISTTTAAEICNNVPVPPDTTGMPQA